MANKNLIILGKLNAYIIKIQGYCDGVIHTVTQAEREAKTLRRACSQQQQRFRIPRF